MSEQNKELLHNDDITQESVSHSTDSNEKIQETQRDPRRLTDIDWSKDTPTTVEAWKALSPEEKLDWSIWHEIRIQHTFATIAILLELISAVVAIIALDCGIGLSILVVLAALILAIVTGVFSYFLYKALRALVAGSMIGTIIAIIAIAFIQDETLQTIAVILSYVVSLSISGIMEAKGAIGKKIPSFPGPKEPGLMDDLKDIRRELKTAFASRPRSTKKSKREHKPMNIGQKIQDAADYAQRMHDTFGV